MGIECDKVGRVYVSVPVRCRIQIFTADGTFSREIGKFNFPSCPLSIAFSSKDTLFVSDRLNHSVLAFSLEGESLCSIGGLVAGMFKFPRGIAVDDYDVLYVCDKDNDCIKIF